MEFFNKWYVKLGLFLIVGLLLTVILIVWDEKETGNVIFSATVPGNLGESQSVSINLKASELTHVLDLEPDIESGWGEPDVYMIVNMYSPNGENLVSVDQDTLWGGIESDNTSRSYTKKFTFKAEVDGDYIVETTVLSDHVEKVYIKIGQRTE